MLLDQGTGCVHTAPGHGEDDYHAGVAHGLDIYSPVGPDGRFDETVGPYQGLQVFQANERIVEDLRQNGSLLHAGSISHSYPHCWRCKKPVIYRATAQWFIAMDHGRPARQGPGGHPGSRHGCRPGARSASPA